MKRWMSALLVLALVMSFLPTAFAADAEAINAAQALYEQGLFSGTGTDANGNPNFSLDRAPTRHEAVTMLVRLLGKADEAVEGTWNTPFTDVVDWAKPYVGYAYAHGLTSGTSATTYGGNSSVTASQYITFVLRALGYEAGKDFQWDKAWELSDKIGLTDGRYNASTANFTRGDVAIISYSSLTAPHKEQPENVPDENTVSVTAESLQGLWGGINRTADAEHTECYRFDGSNYSCAYMIENKSGAMIGMGYEEGMFSISGNTLKLSRAKEYTYLGNGGWTQVSEEAETLEYTISISDHMLTLNNWYYDNHEDDPKTGKVVQEMYETIKGQVMENLASEAPADDYGYLAAADFRAVRRQYSTAVAQCGYAYEFTDLNGDNCVLTIVYYKIRNTYSITVLHNLSKGTTIEDPADYYNRQADRAYGASKMRYWDLSNEVLEHSQAMLKAMLDVMQTGRNTGGGVYVGPEILNQ